MIVTTDFAILAPVPKEHLDAGLDVIKEQGCVAFGTRKWELFRDVDERSKKQPVPMLIYPSHEDVPSKQSFRVSWVGRYVGHVHSNHGAHPEGLRYRPPSTAKNPGDNLGHWAIFWHLDALRQLSLDEYIPIGELQSHSTKKWLKAAPPRGPVLVEIPSELEAAIIDL